MVKRHHKIDFASGAMVFPGKVDPEDSDAEARAATIGAEPFDDTQLGFRVSAIREAFEETGVLIATNKDGSELTAEQTNDLEDAMQRAWRRTRSPWVPWRQRRVCPIRVDRLEALRPLDHTTGDAEAGSTPLLHRRGPGGTDRRRPA